MGFQDRRVTLLRSLPKVVPAQQFNRVRLALLRLGSPLRVQLDGLRGVDLILDHRIWLSVDRFHNDLPILALTDFDTLGRSGLHLPVSCHLHLYQFHAGLVISPVLEALDRVLMERLAPSAEHCAASATLIFIEE